MRLPFAITPSASAPVSPNQKSNTAAASLKPLETPSSRTSAKPTLPRHLRPRNCESSCSSPTAAKESSRISDNSILAQIGVREWAKSASGARLKYLLSRSKSGSFQTQEPESDWNPFLGYIGPQRPAIEPWLHDHTAASRLPSPPPTIEEHGQCFKLSNIPYSEAKDSIQRALLYLKLRKDGCSKTSSIYYSKKRRCMFDSTRQRDGPHCHRTIRLRDNRTSGPNWHGWQLHAPQMEIGKTYQPVEVNTDLHEYEAVAKQFERLTYRQEKAKSDLDFYEADEDREKYFASLQREWERRQRRERKQVPIPKAKTTTRTSTSSDSLTPITPLATLPENPSRNSKAAAFAFLFPQVKVLPAEPESAQTIASDTPVAVIDPAKVDVFSHGTLVIRSLAPTKATAPIIVRKPGRRPTQEAKKSFLEPPSNSNIRRRTFSAYSEFISRMRQSGKKDSLTSTQIAKSQLMLGLAKMCEEVNRSLSVPSKDEPRQPRKSKTFLTFKLFSPEKTQST